MCDQNRYSVRFLRSARTAIFSENSHLSQDTLGQFKERIYSYAASFQETYTQAYRLLVDLLKTGQPQTLALAHQTYSQSESAYPKTA